MYEYEYLLELHIALCNQRKSNMELSCKFNKIKTIQTISLLFFMSVDSVKVIP